MRKAGQRRINREERTKVENKEEKKYEPSHRVESSRIYEMKWTIQSNCKRERHAFWDTCEIVWKWNH